MFSHVFIGTADFERALAFHTPLNHFLTMTLIDFPRPALLLATLALTSACTRAAPDIDNARRNAEVIQRALAALPPTCTLGTLTQASQDIWLTAPKAMPEPDHPTAYLELFDTAATTGAVRAALNRAALAALEKVEFRDAAGKWVDAGSVSVHEAPAGCDYVWLQQDLGGARQLDALRYTFHSSAQPITLANAGILKSR
jgi:hypothetical protein